MAFARNTERFMDGLKLVRQESEDDGLRQADALGALVEANGSARQGGR